MMNLFGGQRAEFVQLFKTFDNGRGSFEDPAEGRSRYTLHTAFDLPATTPQSPARESIECRLLAVFPEGDPALAVEHSKL